MKTKLLIEKDLNSAQLRARLARLEKEMVVLRAAVARFKPSPTRLPKRAHPSPG